MGQVGLPAVGALCRRDLTADEYRTEVALLRAERVRASVGCLRVVKAAEGAYSVLLVTSGTNMSELAAVVALEKTVGGDDGGNAFGTGEEANRGTYRGHLRWPNRDGDRGVEFPLTGGRVGVELSG